MPSPAVICPAVLRLWGGQTRAATRNGNVLRCVALNWFRASNDEELVDERLSCRSCRACLSIASYCSLCSKGIKLLLLLPKSKEQCRVYYRRPQPEASCHGFAKPIEAGPSQLTKSRFSD